jgi:hypothetical protein
MEDRARKNDGTDNILKFNIPSNVDSIMTLIDYFRSGAYADITASNTAPVPGTSINKATQLSAETAVKLFGADSPDVTVNDALKALDPASYDITVSTSAWSSGVCTISHAAILSPSICRVGIDIAENATDEEATAARQAALVYVAGSHSAGSIKFKAEGVIPTINLKLSLIIQLTRKEG